jgi:hypothetical protein
MDELVEAGVDGDLAKLCNTVLHLAEPGIKASLRSPRCSLRQHHLARPHRRWRHRQHLGREMHLGQQERHLGSGAVRMKASSVAASRQISGPAPGGNTGGEAVWRPLPLRTQNATRTGAAQSSCADSTGVALYSCWADAVWVCGILFASWFL